jgi:hypothetical protein
MSTFDWAAIVLWAVVMPAVSLAVCWLSARR